MTLDRACELVDKLVETARADAERQMINQPDAYAFGVLKMCLGMSLAGYAKDPEAYMAKAIDKMNAWHDTDLSAAGFKNAK